MATRKAVKEVQIIARYIHKTDGQPNGTVTYLVRARNGIDTYCTTIINGEASGCSCPSKRRCYHKTQLQAIEVARAETPEQKEEREWIQYRTELAKKLAVQFVTTQCVEQIAEQQNVETATPPIAMELPAELRGYRKKAISTDISTKGNFGSKPFSLTA